MKEKAGYLVSSVHLKMVRERKKLYCEETLNTPETVVKMVEPLFREVDREKMIVISLNAHMDPLAYETIAVGGVTSCAVDMKNIFKHALLANASNIICVHNHPSESAIPSNEGERFTDKLRKAASLLDIDVCDHIVYGNQDNFYSFRENDWKIN